VSVTFNSITYSQAIRVLAVGILLVAMSIAPLLLLQQRASAAACGAPTVDYGSATSSVTVPGAATYRVWTRMQVPNTTDNSYRLEIDGNTCITVGGAGVAAGSWTWVSHQDGTVTSKIDVALTSGSHSLKLIGNKPGVKVDRIVLTSDLACVPTGFGDNCNVPLDTTAPTVKLTSPAANASISGSTVNIAATATDNVGVSRVEFFVDGVSVGIDTSSPYSTTWDSSKVANGDHQLSVRGYDTAGNTSTDSIVVRTSNGDTLAPTAPLGLLAQALAYNSVRLTWSASSDNTAVAGYRVFRDGVPVATTNNGTVYEDSAVNASTSYSYRVEAFDAAGNRSALSTATTVTTPGAPVADTQAPSQPSGLTATAASQSQVNLRWTASTDNIGVVRYDIFRGTGSNVQKVGSSPVTSYGDTGLAAGTSYTYQIVAIDAAGNVSSRSNGTTVSTLAAQPPADHGHAVKGTVKNRSGNRLSKVKIYLSKGDGVTQIVQTNKHGNYAAYDLLDGVYSLSAQKRGYTTLQSTLKMSGSDRVRNITLSRR